MSSILLLLYSEYPEIKEEKVRMVTHKSLITEENYWESILGFMMYVPLTILGNIDSYVLVSLIDILDDLLHAFWNVIETD
jgi:hypothetical protein